MSKFPDGGGNAFPCPAVLDLSGAPYGVGDYGMSLREWYAGLAMQALTVHGLIAISGSLPTRITNAPLVAEMAVELADTMIAVLKKGAHS